MSTEKDIEDAALKLAGLTDTAGIPLYSSSEVKQLLNQLIQRYSAHHYKICGVRELEK